MTAKILVADDEQNIVRLLRLYLRNEGFDVVAAADGRQALDRFSAEAPDLVLLDIGVDAAVDEALIAALCAHATHVLATVAPHDTASREAFARAGGVREIVRDAEGVLTKLGQLAG